MCRTERGGPPWPRTVRCDRRQPARPIVHTVGSTDDEVELRVIIPMLVKGIALLKGQLIHTAGCHRRFELFWTAQVYEKNALLRRTIVERKVEWRLFGCLNPGRSVLCKCRFGTDKPRQQAGQHQPTHKLRRQIAPQHEMANEKDSAQSGQAKVGNQGPPLYERTLDLLSQ